MTFEPTPEEREAPPTVRTGASEQKVLTHTITLSSGKLAQVGMPPDADDRDWLDFLALAVAVVRPEHERRAKRNPLVNLLMGGHNRR